MTSRNIAASYESIDFLNHLVIYGERQNPYADGLTIVQSFQTANSSFEIIFAEPVRTCLKCGDFIRYRTDSNGNIAASTACSLMSVPPIITEVPFRSGRIVLNDTLSHAKLPPLNITKDANGKYVNYNSFAGQRTYVEQSARMGIAYGPVSNTSPAVFLNSETGTLTVELEGSNLQEDETVRNRTKLAGIVTDLWAYSIMDFEEWLKTDPPEEFINSVTVADIPAGTYRFTHYASDPTKDAHDMLVLTEAELITGK